MLSLLEQGLIPQAEPQIARRPSLREINAIAKGLGIHALGRDDYRILLAEGMSARQLQPGRKLVQRRRRRIIPEHRLPAWCDAVMAEPDAARDLLLMVLFTGMRQANVVTLRWDSIDLAGGALYFVHGSSGRCFGLPMSDFLAQLLRQRRAIAGASDWAFPGRGRGGHMTHTQSVVRRVAGRSAVPFAFHDLRRTFIAIAESLNLPLDIVKGLLGHHDSSAPILSIQEKVEQLRDPAQRIADRILRLAKAI